MKVITNFLFCKEVVQNKLGFKTQSSTSICVCRNMRTHQARFLRLGDVCGLLRLHAWYLRARSKCWYVGIGTRLRKQARSQVLRFGGKIHFRGKYLCFYCAFKINFSGHNKFWSGTKIIGGHFFRMPHGYGLACKWAWNDCQIIQLKFACRSSSLYPLGSGEGELSSYLFAVYFDKLSVKLSWTREEWAGENVFPFSVCWWHMCVRFNFSVGVPQCLSV